MGGFLLIISRSKVKGQPMTVDPKNIDIKALLEAGAHFGHKTSRWHPKMAPYIHSKRQGGHMAAGAFAQGARRVIAQINARN